MLDYIKARKNMVDGQIHTAGVVNPLILESFGGTPREIFVPESLRPVVYGDENITVSPGRFILEPITHARLLQAAEPRPSDIVLDVAVGTGYSSAILSSLVMTVIALDKPEFMMAAQRNWQSLGLCNVVPVEGDPQDGLSSSAPFDLIVVNGAVSEIPAALASQLSDDGRLIAIVKDAGQVMGKAVLVKKNKSGGYASRVLFEAGVPYLPEFKPEPAFCF